MSILHRRAKVKARARAKTAKPAPKKPAKRQG